jgi:hypothetical protein
MSWTITPQTKVPVDPQYGSVSLLLHGNGTNGSTTITDNSPSPKTVTAVGNAQISTAQSKFGGSSIAFDGTGDYLTVPSNTAFAFGTDDFTIECWVWFGPAINTYGRIIQCGDYASGGDWQLVRWENTNPAQIAFDMQAGSPRMQSSILISQNTWAHVAVTRSGSTVRMFIDGISAGSVTSSLNLTKSVITVGANSAGLEAHNGYIDDLRITKGIARYTSNFTPPAAPFPDI